MRAEPLFARVVLEREKVKTVSGLIIPESAEKRNAPARGIVRAVGPNADDSVKKLIGKSVLFGKFAGDWMKLPNGDEIYVTQDEDIIAEIVE